MEFYNLQYKKHVTQKKDIKGPGKRELFNSTLLFVLEIIKVIKQNNKEVPLRVIHGMSMQPNTAIPEYTARGNEIHLLKRNLHVHPYCNIIHNSQHMKTTQGPTNG